MGSSKPIVRLALFAVLASSLVACAPDAPARRTSASYDITASATTQAELGIYGWRISVEKETRGRFHVVGLDQAGQPRPDLGDYAVEMAAPGVLRVTLDGLRLDVSQTPAALPAIPPGAALWLAAVRRDMAAVPHYRDRAEDCGESVGNTFDECTGVWNTCTDPNASWRDCFVQGGRCVGSGKDSFDTCLGNGSNDQDQDQDQNDQQGDDQTDQGDQNDGMDTGDTGDTGDMGDTGDTGDTGDGDYGDGSDTGGDDGDYGDGSDYGDDGGWGDSDGWGDDYGDGGDGGDSGGDY